MFIVIKYSLNNRNIIFPYFFSEKRMYSYQKYVRDEKLQDKCNQIRKDFLKDQDNRTKKNKTLVQSYKKRLDGFLLSVIEKPIQVGEHPNQQYKPREIDTLKNISKMPFRMNFNTTSQRLKDVMYRNQYYDEVPFSSTTTHKFRDLASSFNTKPIKFTPSCSIIRIYQTLENTQKNQVPYYENNKVNKILRSPKVSMSQQKYKKYLQKSIMPSISRKTHFNSLQTMYADCPSGFITKKKPEKENISEKYDEELDKDKKQGRSKRKESEHLNQRENAKDALMKCKLLKTRKNPSSSFQKSVR